MCVDVVGVVQLVLGVRRDICLMWQADYVGQTTLKQEKRPDRPWPYITSFFFFNTITNKQK